MPCRSPHPVLFVEGADEAGTDVLCLRCHSRLRLDIQEMAVRYTHLVHTSRNGPDGDFDLLMLDAWLERVP